MDKLSRPKSPEERAAEVVSLYYLRVDAGDIAGILELFAAEAVYERPGYEPFDGRDALRKFYSEERIISSGRHKILSLIVDGENVAVQGAFEGTLRDGTRRAVGFADFFTVRGLIDHRRTYFFAKSI